MSRKTSAEVRDAVRSRARSLCEYCHTDERWQYVRFTIDHVDPEGGDSFDNLALACFHCNRRKSNKTSATDPQSGEIVGLFNPRTDHWGEHFGWSADLNNIVPLSSKGRATEQLLELNRDRIRLIREADVKARRHPPDGDPQLPK